MATIDDLKRVAEVEFSDIDYTEKREGLPILSMYWIFPNIRKKDLRSNRGGRFTKRLEK